MDLYSWDMTILLVYTENWSVSMLKLNIHQNIDLGFKLAENEPPIFNI